MKSSILFTERSTRPCLSILVESSFGRKGIKFVMGIVAVWLVFASSVPAQDWPQILGPNRDGIIQGEELLDSWPEDGPKQLWEAPVGDGFAGPAVVGDQVIVFHRTGKNLLVQSLDRSNGKEQWKKEMPTKYTPGMDGDGGPKCVPLVHKGLIYLHGPLGELFCLNLKDGDLMWEADLLQYFSGRGFFGVGSTPMIIQNKLVLNVGGRDASVVAFDLKTGDEIWKTFDDRASYSSPIVAKLDGKEIAVVISRLHLLGIDPENGDIKFKFRFGSPGPTVNGAMPTFHDNKLFVNAAYNVGGLALDLSGKEPKELWRNKDSYAAQYSTPVAKDGFLFGTAGREDARNGSMRCVKLDTGKVIWYEEDFNVGHTMLVGDKLLINDFTGGLHLLKATSEKFERLAQHQVFPSDARVPAALSKGQLFMRNNAKGGKGKLVCLQVGK